MANRDRVAPPPFPSPGNMPCTQHRRKNILKRSELTWLGSHGLFLRSNTASTAPPIAAGIRKGSQHSKAIAMAEVASIFGSTGWGGRPMIWNWLQMETDSFWIAFPSNDFLLHEDKNRRIYAAMELMATSYWALYKECFLNLTHINEKSMRLKW